MPVYAGVSESNLASTNISSSKDKRNVVGEVKLSMHVSAA